MQRFLVQIVIPKGILSLESLLPILTMDFVSETQTHIIVWVGLELTGQGRPGWPLMHGNPPASASEVLGLLV